MELRGHILPPGTHSPAGPPPGRLQELRERQRGLRQALGLRLRELRRLCLQEAELTGKLPPEYPLEPGERPQPPPRRRSAAPPRGPLTEAARAARREVAVQLQVVEAARRLASAPGLPPEQRRRRQRLQAEAAQRLRQLRAQLDENGSLCELPGLENGFPPPKPPLSGAGRPSPPRAPSGSPDRRPLWASDPSPGGPSRRNSLASPASPARTLPRSASSFEGRSVPATPVLARSPHGPPLCRPESSGLPPRPWSGSQDSQLGGPPPGVSSPPQPPPPSSSALPPPPRTRRSNSSEALIDWGGATPEPPPEASRGRCAPPSAEQRRSQKWLALEGLRDWYLRHTGGPQNAPLPPPQPPQPPRPQPPAWPPPRRRDPPGLPHSLSYAGALTPRDPPAADPDPQPPGTLV